MFKLDVLPKNEIPHVENMFDFFQDNSKQ